jgi:hypothetical protein
VIVSTGPSMIVAVAPGNGRGGLDDLPAAGSSSWCTIDLEAECVQTVIAASMLAAQ